LSSAEKKIATVGVLFTESLRSHLRINLFVIRDATAFGANYNFMSKTNLIRGIMAFSVLALLGGGIVTAKAATNGFAYQFANTNGDQAVNLRNRGRAPLELTAEQKATMEARMASREAEMQAISAALQAGDYNAWLTAVKAENENCPLLETINATNFGRYAEAHKLHLQAQTIMEELGIERPGKGFGAGAGAGMGGAFGHGRGLGQIENLK
jgi:hypothetical protein